MKGTIHKTHPLVKIKTKTSDGESICTEITQYPFLLKCTSSLDLNLSENEEISEIIKFQNKSNHTNKIIKARATQHNVKAQQ